MPNEQTTVPLFVASEVLTAADMNLSAGTGVPVFSNTTTRDAGFGGAGEKVLAEGQLCYLSDSNIVQYYTGAAWATVGPVSAPSTAFTSGQQDTNSTSYVALTTATSVTVTTGTTALVIASAGLLSATANAASFMSFAVSGATTVAASDNFCAQVKQSGTIDSRFFSTLVYYVTGLTAGSNTFSLQYKTSAGFTYVLDRRILVFPL